METRTYDNETKLSDNPTLSDFAKTVADSRNKMVAIHKPGSKVTLPSGAIYEVTKSGAWIKIKNEKK